MKSKISKLLASCILSSSVISNIGITKVYSMEQQFNYKDFMNVAKTNMSKKIFDYFLITVGDVYAHLFEHVDSDEFGTDQFIDKLRYTVRGGHWVTKKSLITLPLYPSMYVSKSSWSKMEPYVRTLCANLENLNMEELTILTNEIQNARNNQYIGTGYQRKEEVDLAFLKEDDFEIDIDPFEGLDITGYSGINAPENSVVNGDETVCSICLKKLEKSESCIVHKKHIYHEGCLQQWWKGNNPKNFQVCPMCKQNVRGSVLIRVKYVADKSPNDAK